MPGPGEPEEIQVELKAVTIRQEMMMGQEGQEGGIVLKLEEMRLAQSVKAFAKQRSKTVIDNY